MYILKVLRCYNILIIQISLGYYCWKNILKILRHYNIFILQITFRYHYRLVVSTTRRVFSKPKRCCSEWMIIFDSYNESILWNMKMSLHQRVFILQKLLALWVLTTYESPQKRQSTTSHNHDPESMIQIYINQSPPISPEGAPILFCGLVDRASSSNYPVYYLLRYTTDVCSYLSPELRNDGVSNKL